MEIFKPGLYIVSTPIGNLNDITIRAIEILKKSDIILCEDTRRSIKLLNHLKIKKKLISYYKFNERKKLSDIIKHLNEGKILSLISDAGTPTISDPGTLLIRECIQKNISIYPVPGANSITTAMSVSGFESQFIFFGFLPKTEKQVEKVLEGLRNLEFSIVFFISGIKIDFYLKIFKQFFSGREILIARELTKSHETFYRDTVDKIKPFRELTKSHETFYRDTVDKIKPFNSSLKGELTVVISKNQFKKDYFDESEIKEEAKKLLKKYSLKDTVDLISEGKKIERKKIYKLCLSQKK